MTDRELMQQALEALDLLSRVPKAKRDYADRAIAALRERLAQPEQEPVIDKSAAIRIATALGWVPPGDTSQERVDQAQKQRHEQEPVVKWDASAPLVVTPHPAFQATLVAEQERKRWHKAGARAIRMAINIEREACAKVCDVVIPGDEYSTALINSYADAIRARGNT